jgi:hypothetical protein
VGLAVGDLEISHGDRPSCIVIVKAATVIVWQRDSFRAF